MAKLLATFVSAKNSEVKEAEENGEMNDIDPDVVNQGTPDENEEWKESFHTEISEGRNVASLFEDEL